MGRIERAAAARVARIVDAIAEAAGEVPGVEVSREDGRVVIAGRGLGLRMMEDARLRGLGFWGRTGR